MMADKIELGQKVGNLVPIAKLDRRTNKSVWWRCRCICGREKDFRQSDLLRSHTRSCGCFKDEKRRLFSFQSADREMLRLYRNHARLKEREFTLTDEQALRLFKQTCTYCGSPPSKNYRARVKRQILVNGIDRIDNTKGYTPGNVVTACTVCNMMKHKLGVREFLDQVHRIASYNSWWSRLKRYLRAYLWCLI